MMVWNAVYCKFVGGKTCLGLTSALQGQIPLETFFIVHVSNSFLERIPAFHGQFSVKNWVSVEDRGLTVFWYVHSKPAFSCHLNFH